MGVFFRRVTAIMLIIAVFAANFSFLSIWAGFRINRDHIARTLCINRLKPRLHCNGKCYFMRQVKDAGLKEKTGESQSHKYQFHDIFFSSVNDTHFYSGPSGAMRSAGYRLALPLIAIAVFQPPPLA